MGGCVYLSSHLSQTCQVTCVTAVASSLLQQGPVSGSCLSERKAPSSLTRNRGELQTDAPSHNRPFLSVHFDKAYFSKGRLNALPCSLSEDDSNNESVKTEGFTEDEDQNHADEDSFLLSVCAHTSVTDNTNSETSSLKFRERGVS